MANLYTPDMAEDDLYSLSGMSHKNPDNLNDDIVDIEDDEDIGFFFINHVDVDDFQNINTAIESLVELENKTKDLLYLFTDVQAATGMRREFAMEAEKLLPGFGNVPLGYYTETTTMTRYKVSLEEMSKGIWAMIAAAVAVLIGIIAKLFSRVSKKGATSGEGTKESAESAVDDEIKDVKTTEEVIKDTDKTIKAGDSVLNHKSIPMLDEKGQGFHCTSFQVAIDRLLTDDDTYGRAKEFLEFKDPIFYDIITNGAYSNSVISVGKKISAINDLLRTKIDVITSIIKANIHSSMVADDLNNVKKLKSVSNSVELTIDGKQMKLEEIVDYLSDIRRSLSDTSVKKDVNFDSLFMSIDKIYKTSGIVNILTDVKRSFSTLDAMKKQLTSIEGILRNMATDGIPGAVTVEVSHELRETVTVISRDIISFNKLYSELEYFTHSIKRLSNEALGFSQIIVSKITAEMHANEYVVPDEWQKVTDELKEYKKIIKLSFLSS